MSLCQQLEPLLRRVCEYTAFQQSGVFVSYETLLAEVRGLLDDWERRCQGSSQDLDNYLKIRQAVVFFIDYTIKESGFSFSEQYQPLARDFNELSGDDKFFDLLQQSLERDENREVLQVFYLLLGLGFDGAFKRDRPRVLTLMNTLKDRLELNFDPRTQLLCPNLQERPPVAAPDFSPLSFLISRKGLMLLFVLTLVALALNTISFNVNVSDLVDAIEQAALSARPYSS